MKQQNKRKLRIVRDPEHQLAATFVTHVCSCGEESVGTTVPDALNVHYDHLEAAESA